MIQTSRCVVLVLSLAMGLSACQGHDAANPASPTPAPATPLPSFTLSGVISVTTPGGAEPVAEALVVDTDTQRRATTDPNGFYSMPGVDARLHHIAVSRHGLVTEMRTLTISGDTRLDVQFRRPYTLSGVAFELTATGRVPIEGVEVYCDACGPEGHTLADTGADGSYAFEWVPGGALVLLVRKEGYLVPAAQVVDGLQGLQVIVDGDTRVDIELARR